MGSMLAYIHYIPAPAGSVMGMRLPSMGDPPSELWMVTGWCINHGKSHGKSHGWFRGYPHELEATKSKTDVFGEIHQNGTGNPCWSSTILVKLILKATNKSLVLWHVMHNWRGMNGMAWATPKGQIWCDHFWPGLCWNCGWFSFFWESTKKNNQTSLKSNDIVIYIVEVTWKESLRQVGNIHPLHQFGAHLNPCILMIWAYLASSFTSVRTQIVRFTTSWVVHSEFQEL